MSDAPKLDHILEPLRPFAVAIEDLTPDPQNARLHDRRNVDAVKESLRRFGFRQLIVVQREGMVVRAGNCRLAASQELGWTHVPALVVDENDVEAALYAVADNRTAELADWDYEALSSVMREYDLGDLAQLGWEQYELEPLLSAEWTPPPLDDETEFTRDEEEKKGAITRYGWNPPKLDARQAEVVYQAVATQVAMDTGAALVAICQAHLDAQ